MIDSKTEVSRHAKIFKSNFVVDDVISYVYVIGSYGLLRKFT